MITLECSECGRTTEVPSLLTVTDGNIDGWEGQIEDVKEHQVVISSFKCPQCVK